MKHGFHKIILENITEYFSVNVKAKKKKIIERFTRKLNSFIFVYVFNVLTELLFLAPQHFTGNKCISKQEILDIDSY